MKAPNAAITCSHCQKEIPFVKRERLPNMLSVKCPHCGRRTICASTEVRAFSSPKPKK
jgi:hypothetical protein